MEKEAKEKNTKEVVKKAKASVKKVEKKEEKKEEVKPTIPKNNGKLKYIIMGIVLLGVIVIGTILGFILHKSNSSVGTDWGDTYFEFVKNAKNSEESEVTIEDNSKFEFIDVPNVSEPVMVVNYNKDNVDHSDVYFINDSVVSNVIDLGLNDVKLLYNIEKKEYDWYGYTKVEDEEKYILLSDKINGSEEAQEYSFKEAEEISVDTVSGEKMSIAKFDTVFIEVEADVKEVDFSEKMTDDELKDALTDAVKEYKETDKITSGEVKTKVENKEKEVVQKQEDMKKAEEELKIKLEEEAKKGYKVGNYTLKYGTYKSEYDGDVVGNTGRYTLKNDGTYTYSKPSYRGWDAGSKKWVDIPGGAQESGTYKAENINEYGTYILSICFTPTYSSVQQYETYSKGVSEECFRVSSNDSWDGVQYQNKYRFIG